MLKTLGLRKYGALFRALYERAELGRDHFMASQPTPSNVPPPEIRPY